MRDARPLGVALLGCLGLLTAAGVGSGERAGQARAGRHLTTTRVARRPAAFPFLFIEANDVVKGTYEVTMTCPAHKHGTPEQAMKKLKVMQLAMPADREVRLWACRARQISTVKMFAPAANVIIVNPFAVRSLTGPGPDALVWPGLDQPLINQMRQLRAAAGATRLLACIDVKDPDYLSG